MTPKSVAATAPHRRSCSYTRRLLRYAVASRLFVLTLIIIWRSLVSPYDTSASINPPCLTSSTDSSNRHGPSVLLPSVGSAIENSIVWDSVYFIRIAECGYEYEQTYAFLPLLPLCISFLSKTVFAPLEPLVGYRAVLGLSGYILNNIAFVFASLYLYWLSVFVLKDREVALRASVLFCFNPASIFYSSIYSESLYAFLSFGGLYHFMNGTDYFATVWLALSGCARSNGVLNAGYICYRKMQLVNKAFLSRKCPYGGGLLKIFRVKQLPNFLLASPILSVALCSIVYYVKLWPEVFLSLGLRASLQKELVGSPLSKATEGQTITDGLLENDSSNLLQGVLSLVGAKLVQAFFGFISISEFLEQVATRFLSASPLLYWFASHIMGSPGIGRRWGYLIWAYCGAYIFLGSLLFSNFYPFT
ncbi:UNVERIFIED_CONTAM: GPI mannosyltransferase 2 [Sesamum latifolium]|uniref:GPI mannosyltransferase 2 n=1 Tax=Sesamum latifolium TaxID=2727402 RepID=A0AAW2ULE0_9LAMI